MLALVKKGDDFGELAKKYSGRPGLQGHRRRVRRRQGHVRPRVREGRLRAGHRQVHARRRSSRASATTSSRPSPTRSPRACRRWTRSRRPSRKSSRPTAKDAAANDWFQQLLADYERQDRVRAGLRPAAEGRHAAARCRRARRCESTAHRHGLDRHRGHRRHVGVDRGHGVQRRRASTEADDLRRRRPAPASADDRAARRRPRARRAGRGPGRRAWPRSYGAGSADVRAPDALRRVLAAAGVDHDPDAPTHRRARPRGLAAGRRRSVAAHAARARDVLEGRAAAAALTELWARDGPPAARLPVGPRADGRDDRAAHHRGGLRGRRRRRWPGRRARSSSTSSATCCSRPTSWRCSRARPAPATWPASPTASARSSCAAIRTSSAPSRPTTRRAVLRNWEAIKRDDEGREGIFHDVPGNAAGAAPGPQAAAARRRPSASTGSAGPRPGRRCDEELGGAARGAGRRRPADEAVRHEAGDLLFAAVNVLRLAGVDPELALRARRRPLPRAGRGARRRSRRAEGRDFRVLGLDEQDGYYRRAKTRPGDEQS